MKTNKQHKSVLSATGKLWNPPQIAVVRCRRLNWIESSDRRATNLHILCFPIRLSSNIIDDRLVDIERLLLLNVVYWLHLLVDWCNRESVIKGHMEFARDFIKSYIEFLSAMLSKAKIRKTNNKKLIEADAEVWSMCFPQSQHDTRVQIESSAIVWMDHAIMRRAQIKCRLEHYYTHLLRLWFRIFSPSIRWWRGTPV